MDLKKFLELPESTWARVELVKLDAWERLCRDVADARRILRSPVGNKENFQFELAILCADYVHDWFFALHGALRDIRVDFSTFQELSNRTFNALLESVAPVWLDLGGQPEYWSF